MSDLICTPTESKAQPVKFPAEFIKIFWSRIAITDGCWEWTRGTTNRSGQPGYGVIWFQKKKHLTHRLAYELAYGEIGQGLLVCHRCDNPPCCNPKHLFLGDAKANAQDKQRKGRNVFQKDPDKLTHGDRHWTRAKPDKVFAGETHPQSKLTMEQVQQIFADRASGMSERKIAERYDVHNRTIHRILNGTGWKTALTRQGGAVNGKCACGQPLTQLNTGHTVCANKEWPHAWSGDVGLHNDGLVLALALRDANARIAELEAELATIRRIGADDVPGSE